MPSIDPALVGKEMLAAAHGVLKKRWPRVRDYASQELKKLAQDIAFIEEQVALGKMTEQQAKLHFGIQRNAARTVLLTIEGIGLLAAEEAINAALKVVSKSVNTALGFVLL
jgi:hypothetical protein